MNPHDAATYAHLVIEQREAAWAEYDGQFKLILVRSDQAIENWEKEVAKAQRTVDDLKTGVKYLLASRRRKCAAMFNDHVVGTQCLRCHCMVLTEEEENEFNQKDVQSGVPALPARTRPPSGS